jgi:hypothetical protein
LIKIQSILILAVIISLLLPLQYHTLKFANGENKIDSTLVMYNDNNSKYPVLADSENTIIKPKIEVSIEGTPNDDQLKGGEGDDKINGEDGNDIISGKEGNDKMNGGKGDDVINGQFGNDTLKGGNGDDKINGERGNDLIDGGKGDDILIGGEGDEGILGNEGSDVLNGSEGFDIMAGGTGDDTFICDLFDTILDFDIEEGDKIIGQCSSLDQQTEFERSLNNTPQEDSQSGSPPSSPLPPPFPRFNNQIPLEGFQAGPPPPSSVHPNNGPPEEFKLPPQTSPQPQLEPSPSPSPPSFYPNNQPTEEFKLPLQTSPQPQPQLESPPPISHDDIPPEDFELFPPFPVHPANEVHLRGT